MSTLEKTYAVNQQRLVVCETKKFLTANCSPVWIEIISDLVNGLNYSYSRIAYRIGSSPSSVQKLAKDSSRIPRDKMFFNLSRYYYKVFYASSRSVKAAAYVEEKKDLTLYKLIQELSYRGYIDEVDGLKNIADFSRLFQNASELESVSSKNSIQYAFNFSSVGRQG